MDKEVEVVIVGASYAMRRRIVAALIDQITVDESVDFNKPIAIHAVPNFDDHLLSIKVAAPDTGPIKHRKGGKKSRRIWDHG